MSTHRFTGFGFGPIQSGLFVCEAYRTGAFDRIVVAEIDDALVQAVRAAGGVYHVNVAHADGVEVVRVENVELLNPSDAEQRTELLAALAASTEIVTSLPAVKFYDTGGTASVADLIAQSRRSETAPPAIIYTAENHNHAAEILAENLTARLGPLDGRLQCLNTVIGKMSRVVTDPDEVARLQLAPIAPGIGRAFLVEAFNHILVTKTTLAGFRPGIDVFVEKADLLPFEEAKLYGHNAIHALLAYLGAWQGYAYMTDLKQDARLMDIARRAFLDESGAALIAKYGQLGDALFTPAGYRAYADDLLERMTNPYLQDTTARAARDPLRKLGYHDRICGTMTLALEHGIRPTHMALGLAAGLKALLDDADAIALPAGLRQPWEHLSGDGIAALLAWLHRDPVGPHTAELIELAQAAHRQLQNW